MHLSEGVLHTPVLLAGVALAGVGVAVGLRRLESERLPLTALFAAAFFVAGTIHVPVGIGSVHLILNGMAGLFLGWAVFPAFLIALLLQVLFFSFWRLCRIGREFMCHGIAGGRGALCVAWLFKAGYGSYGKTDYRLGRRHYWCQWRRRISLSRFSVRWRQTLSGFNCLIAVVTFTGIRVRRYDQLRCDFSPQQNVPECITIYWHFTEH